MSIRQQRDAGESNAGSKRQHDETRQDVNPWFSSGAQLAALCAENPQFVSMLQIAPMMGNLALAASFHQAQSLNTTRPNPPFPEACRQLPVSGSLSSKLGKRLLSDLEEVAIHKRSKSENNLLASDGLEHSDVENASAKPTAVVSASKLMAIREQDWEDAEMMDKKETDGYEDIKIAQNGARDDKEVKKMRRKQSNRESARRSRLRKQRESEALSTSVTGLKEENQQLREANRSLQAKVQELTERLAEGSNQEAPARIAKILQRGSAFHAVHKMSEEGSRM